MNMRLSTEVYDEARRALHDWLSIIVQKVYMYTLHARRRTVSKNDVIYGLKSYGITLYD